MNRQIALAFANDQRSMHVLPDGLLFGLEPKFLRGALGFHGQTKFKEIV